MVEQFLLYDASIQSEHNCTALYLIRELDTREMEQGAIIIQSHYAESAVRSVTVVAVL